MIVGNSCGICEGGGVKVSNSSLTVTNSIIVGNVAYTYGSGQGGGISANSSSILSLVSTTISGNYSGMSGGGVKGDFTSVNSVIWGNLSDGSSSSSQEVDGTVTASYSLIKDKDLTGSGTGNLDGTLASSDPLFINSIAPSSTPKTQGDYRLGCSSPLLDIGNNSANATILDLDGTPRIKDGDNDATATIDIGAYEKASFITRIVQNTNNSGAGSLRQTIAEACAGDTILFHPSIDGNPIVLTSEISFSKNIVIIGNDSTNTIIDGDDNSRIFNATNTDSLIIHSLSIKNGRSTGSGGAIRLFAVDKLIVNEVSLSNNTGLSGGAISMANPSAINSFSVSNSKINNNTSSGSGGGVNLSSPRNDATLTNTYISNNNATNNGGGIAMIAYSSSNSITLFHSEVSNNSSDKNGGGIFQSTQNLSPANSDIKLDSSKIIGNSATDHGGGIYTRLNNTSNVTTVEINNSEVSGNQSSKNGGGIYTYAHFPTTTITNSSLFNNSSGEQGGGIYSHTLTGEATSTKSLVTVSNSTISGNSSMDEGGGIYSYAECFPKSSYSTVNLTKSTVAGNSSSISGGGIYSSSSSTLEPGNSSVNLTNSTLTGNTATIDGKGIYSSSNSSTINLSSSIVANSGINNFYNNQSPTITSQGYNILSEASIVGSVSTDQLGIDSAILNLGPLQLNGGVTPTMLPGCGSVALNMGNPADVTYAQNGTLIGRRDVGAAESYFVINFSTDVITACDSLTWIDGKTYDSSNNTATDTLTNSVGCDSIITLNLTINNTNYDTVAIASCYSYLSPSGNYTWTTAGMYQDTILTTSGCDSIITINLTIKTTTYGSFSDTNCFSYTSPSGKYTWTASGTYQDTILNRFGCDSVMSITLTIKQNGNKTVMNFNDNGPGSLRDFASEFCSGDTIFFDPSTNGNPILLTSGQIVIDKDVVIMGIDSASTIIDGNNMGRIFYIAPGVTVTMSNIKLINGKAKEGGAIYNRGNLTLDAVSLVNNKAQISNLGHTKGGAIYNTGRITITNSSFIGNIAIANGVSNSYAGAIFNWGTCIMTNCVAKGNSAVSFHGLVLAGVIYNHVKSKFELTNSLLSGNEARTGYYGYGGAVVNRRGVVSTITNTSLIDNFAKSNGGAIHNLHFPNAITIVGGVLQGNQTENGPNNIGQGVFDIR